MYGIVIKAIEVLILEKAGPDAWDQIKLLAHIEADIIVSSTSYPDAIVYKLIDAASEVLNLPKETVLILFGEHWIQYTAKVGYNDLLTVCGENFRSFMRNLPNLHPRMVFMFPSLMMPVFTTREDGNAVEVTYQSSRKGLEPMVRGLLIGVAKRFKQKVELTCHPVGGTPAQPVYSYRLTMLDS